MKKNYLLFVIALLCGVYSNSQSDDNGLTLFCNLLIKERGYTNAEDSARKSQAIRDFCKQFRIRRYKLVTNGTGSSHFLLFGRTMMLNRDDSSNLSRVLLNELPHAEQFAQRPFFYSLLFAKGFVSTFFGAFSLTKKERNKARALRREKKCNWLVARLWVVYERLEFIAGTAEYDAHHKRQPKIEMDFYQMLATSP